MTEYLQTVSWLKSQDVRPYIFMRKENLFANPGTLHSCDWFDRPVLIKDALRMSEVTFADQILELEGLAFQDSNMKMPRWVFYDCAVVPGFVCGFAAHRSRLSQTALQILKTPDTLEWVPISLFIIIPTVRPGEWVAHNLCTINSIRALEGEPFYGLGFLTKAFGLWYANVDVLCGMTQWTSPALKLHSHYGPFQVLTAYTPVHSYAQTLTYKSKVTFKYWQSFFDKSLPDEGLYQKTDFVVEPQNDERLKAFQEMIESGQGPFYLKSGDLRSRQGASPIPVYRLAHLAENQ
jgi:hypothetical protein